MNRILIGLLFFCFGCAAPLSPEEDSGSLCQCGLSMETLTNQMRNTADQEQLKSLFQEINSVQKEMNTCFKNTLNRYENDVEAKKQVIGKVKEQCPEVYDLLQKYE